MRCAELAADLGSVRDAARANHMLGMIRYYRREIDVGEELLCRHRTGSTAPATGCS